MSHITFAPKTRKFHVSGKSVTHKCPGSFVCEPASDELFVSADWRQLCSKCDFADGWRHMLREASLRVQQDRAKGARSAYL